MARDDIFKYSEMNREFQFDGIVADVFDDMLNRSVPCYRMVIEMTGAILDKFLQDGDRVYDLGCSTGETLVELARQLDRLNLYFTGIDNSPAMLSKARHKAGMFALASRLDFREADIVDLDISGAGAIIMNYTLQFIRPMTRLQFVNKLYNSLPTGGMCIVSEKIISHDKKLNREFINIYHQFKRQQGYSELEIAAKREALEHVLVPFSIEETIDLLRQAGFQSVETFFQWFNFASFVAIKQP